MEKNLLELIEILKDIDLHILFFCVAVLFLVFSLINNIDLNIPVVVNFDYNHKRTAQIIGGIFAVTSLIISPIYSKVLAHTVIGKNYSSNVAEYRVTNTNVKNGKVNFRTRPDPSTKKNIIREISDGEKVRFIPKPCGAGQDQSNPPNCLVWVPIEYEGKEGWIKAEFLTEQ